MSTQKDYTHEEWIQVKEAAFSAGLTASLVDLSLLGYSKEMAGIEQGLDEAKQTFPMNELIQAILDSINADAQVVEEGGEVEEVLDEGPDTGDTKEIVRRELAKINKAVGIVAQKSPAAEVLEYKRFLYHVAEKATTASGEGFLGLSRNKISNKEAEFLQQLKDTLQI